MFISTKNDQKSSRSIIMLRFGETKVTKENFYAEKKQYKFWMLMLTE